MKNVEVEIQVIIKDIKEAEKRLREVGKFIKSRKQVDEYFITRHRNFFVKNPPVEYLRVRHEKGKSHLNYSFLHFGKNGWLKSTDEYETIIGDPKTVSQIFKKIGLIPKVIVVKTRKYFNCGSFEITLDQVNGLGNFMEVEAKKDLGGISKTRKACRDFLDKLNIKYELKRDMGYPRMLYRKLYKN